MPNALDLANAIADIINDMMADGYTEDEAFSYAEFCLFELTWEVF